MSLIANDYSKYYIKKTNKYFKFLEKLNCTFLIYDK